MCIPQSSFAARCGGGCKETGHYWLCQLCLCVAVQHRDSGKVLKMKHRQDTTNISADRLLRYGQMDGPGEPGMTTEVRRTILCWRQLQVRYSVGLETT